MKSKFTQREISTARRVYNNWQTTWPTITFAEYMNEETKKGFADSVDNLEVAPFKIVKS